MSGNIHPTAHLPPARHNHNVPAGGTWPRKTTGKVRTCCPYLTSPCYLSASGAEAHGDGVNAGVRRSHAGPVMGLGWGLHSATA